MHMLAVIDEAVDLPSKDYVDLAVATKANVRVVTVISGATTMAAVANTDYVYVCGGTTYTVTLPTAVGSKNMYTVKRTATGNVTVGTTASQTIDGAATFVIGTQWMAIDLVSDGSNWVIT